MSFDAQRLYGLLPALYRIRDTELGLKSLTDKDKAAIENGFLQLDEAAQGPLKALLSIIAEQVAVLEENLDQLYDDQFIETCAEWAVSYIGDLVGTRGLIQLPNAGFSQRAEVANTIGYRRRKGTASVIEQLARDVTGWNANVVEYFQLLATTQYMNHVRLENQSFASLRNGTLLEYANTPFDKMAHTADVRRIEKKRGKYNIQNIGIFLWRLQNHSFTNTPAYKVDGRRYTFHPLGKNTALYNFPETEDTITHLAEPINVPMPISRRVLAGNLDIYYGQQKAEEDEEAKDKSILVYTDGKAVLPENANPPVTQLSDLIAVCDLRDVYDEYGLYTGWAHMPENRIAIDPVLGRIAFPASEPEPSQVRVTFHHAFSAEMGGGEYDRAATFTEDPKTTTVIEIAPGGQTIQEALDALAATGGVVEILDNSYYFETPVIRVAAGKTIELRAADKVRPVLVLEGELLIEAEANANVVLNGLLISGGRVRVPLRNGTGETNRLQSLRLEHCTLLPGSFRCDVLLLEPGYSPHFDAVAAQPPMSRLVVETPGTRVELEKTITGALNVMEDATVDIRNSIVDAGEKTSIAYSGLSGEEPGGLLSITNSTVIGRVYTRIMDLASNSIFVAADGGSENWTGPVVAQRLQQGCVRFSYVPPGSRLPRLYHCQPITALSDDLAGSPPVAVNADRVRPVFTSLSYGDAGYGQLSNQTPEEIKQGADDEAEMGVFHDLYQPQREKNLRTRLDEYLRFGLEAGIFYAS